MVPKQPALDAAQGEELLQIIIGLIDDFIRTGDKTAQKCSSR